MSADADFSTLLKCLASGKKSIEQLRPSAPRQTSALELLVVYCFHILLVYPCALYYGMLILSRALGACPTWLRVYQYTHQPCESAVLDASQNHTHNECFEFLFNCRSETQAWDLQSLLIKPVQRVLKYPLLLDKLVASTSAKHPDHTAVHNARDAISQVAQDINEVKK